MTKVLSFASKTKSCFLSKFHQYSMKKEERGLNQHSNGSSLCIFCPRSFFRKISSDCYNQSIQLDVVTFQLEFLQGCSLFAKRGTEDKILDHLITPTNYFQNLKPKAKQKGEFSFKRRPAISCSYEGAVTGSDSKSVNFPLT